jgi:hypothetical protein
MPVTKVIQLAPTVDLMVVSSVQLLTLQQRLTVMLTQVDENGELVRGGREVTDTLTDTDFDELIALMLPTFLPAIVAKLITRGKIANGASVADISAGSPTLSIQQ